MKKEEVIAIDVGYSYVKMVTSDQHIIFPARIGPAPELTFVLGNKMEKPGEKVTVSDKTYLVGQSADLCGTTFTMRTRDWISSPMYLALIVSAFARLMPLLDLSADFSIVAGLPVLYMADKTTAAEQIRTAASILNLNLKSIEIIPQPFGTFFDHVLDMTAEPAISNKIALVGVVDVGYHSTDFILVQDLQHNIERAAGSITVGVSSIYDGIKNDLMHRLGRNKITTTEIEECVSRSKTIRIGKRVQDVSMVIQPHMDNTAQTIIGVIKSAWAQEAEIDVVLLSGGGGILLKEHLSGISDNTLLKAGAQIANARGYFKRGVLMQKASKIA